MSNLELSKGKNNSRECILCYEVTDKIRIGICEKCYRKVFLDKNSYWINAYMLQLYHNRK